MQLITLELDEIDISQHVNDEKYLMCLGKVIRFLIQIQPSIDCRQRNIARQSFDTLFLFMRSLEYLHVSTPIFSFP